MLNQTKSLGVLNAQTLGEYILANYGPMSHLKLQKLLFYCEAYHLAQFDDSLVKEEFQAWVHGPVCREVYDAVKGVSVLYSDIKYTGDNTPNEIFEHTLTFEQKDFITDILKELSTWTGPQLEAATHGEQPWVETRKGLGAADKCDRVISKELMKSYYRAELKGELQ